MDDLGAIDWMIKMKKLLHTTALIAIANPIAFDPGNNTWKKDADGKLEVDANGNPIFVGADGKEQSVKGDTIATLNSEAKTHRTAKEAAEAKLAEFGDITPADAKKNAETLKDVDLSKMVNADKLDEVRREVGAEFQTKLDEAVATNKTLQTGMDQMMLDNAFAGSKYIQENIDAPLDMFAATFKANFKVEDGKIVAYNAAGNKLNSTKNMGELAGFDEALEQMVEGYSHKDKILKADDQRGSGNNGNGGNGGGGGSKMSRAAFNALQPGEQAAAAAKAGKGEITITD